MDYSPNPNRPRGILPVLCYGHRKLPKQKGIITFILGANRQRPLAGVLHNAIFNTTRRCRGQMLYVVPPLLGAYLLLDWAEKKNRWLNSKEGRLTTEETEK
ncbi:ubiquinol-cytochrome c reductase complex ubiquinone-binding protein [Cadophora sp. MPI-SDFR-AT-0126]|nr:ubiquinol-cytochrome c reductase complex ubiquinone-binding protein [Leotiomycetes sp. MPI-SDFR-AT-0126]